MSITYIYPYEPLRDIVLGQNKNPDEKSVLWLIIFLMRLGVLADATVNTQALMVFAEKYGNFGEQGVS